MRERSYEMTKEMAIDLIVLENMMKMEKIGITSKDLTSVEYHELLFHGKVPKRFEKEKNTIK